MACNLTSARGLSCKDTVGGVKAIYLANFDPTFSPAFTYASGVLDGVDNAISVYRYDVRPQTASLITTVASDAAGSAAYTTALEVTLHTLSQPDHEELQKVIQTRFFCFALDANDVVYCLGLVNGCVVTGGTMSIGAARTDLHGYTLTIESAEGVFPPQGAPSADTSSANWPFDGIDGGTAAVGVTNP